MAFNSELVISQAISSVVLIPRVSVAVCDNAPGAGSLPASIDAARTAGIRIRTMVCPENPGFAVACNRLASGSHADWLVFLNPDARIVSWPWTASAPPANTILGGEQRTSHGDPLLTHGVEYTVRDEVRRSWFRRDPQRPVGAGFVGGGALAIQRSLFNDLGGFDEQFFMFYEDIDLCFRAHEEGAKIIACEQWEVIHDLGHSARRDLKSALLGSYSSGRRFHRRHDNYLWTYDMYVATDAALRALMWIARRDPRSKPYRAVLRKAVLNLVSRKPESDQP